MPVAYFALWLWEGVTGLISAAIEHPDDKEARLQRSELDRLWVQCQFPKTPPTRSERAGGPPTNPRGGSV